MSTEINDLLKSIDSLIDSVYAESTVTKSLDIAGDSKTTADAAIAAAPAMQDDASRGAGRPKQISDVPKTDEDGSRDGSYDASIASVQAESENDEAKKQAKSIDQTSSTGRLAEAPKMKDPRLSKSLTDEEWTEFQAFKKSQAEAAETKKQEELKKSEDLRKAELESIVKSAITSAVAPLQRENEELKKSLNESAALVKAMASQPQRSKSVTGIDAIEKSSNDNSGPKEFSKAEKLDAAERLVFKKSLPMDAVVELENTGTVYRQDWRKQIEAELEKNG